MKLKIPISTFVFFIMAFSYQAMSQTPINLNVDTENIGPPGPNTWQYCYFDGQSAGDDPREFETSVNLGDYLEWTGQSLNGEDTIFIRMIRMKPNGGQNIFNVPQIVNIPGQTGNPNLPDIPAERSVKGIVRNSTRQGPPDQQFYRYKISFTINGLTGPMYSIDPIITTNY